MSENINLRRLSFRLVGVPNWLVLFFFGFFVGSFSQVLYGNAEEGGAQSIKQENPEIAFSDVEVQATEFISYYNSITLTPEQEEIKKTALTSIAAPCCSKFTMYTCCCSCNLAKSVWGLSNNLITKHHYNADQVYDAVSNWIKFINAKGFSGDTCFTGKCNFAFRDGGCGGMTQQLVV